MKKQYSESKELLTMAIALSAVSVGSFTLLVALLLATPLVLTAELLVKLTRWSQSLKATT